MRDACGWLRYNTCMTQLEPPEPLVQSTAPSSHSSFLIPHSSLRGVVYVGLAVFFFSTSPVLVRWAAPLSPLVIAAGRLLVAAGALGLAVAWSRRPRSAPAEPTTATPGTGRA